MLPEKVFPEKCVRVSTLEETRNLLANDFRVNYATTDLANIEISPEGVVHWNGDCLPYTQYFLESLARLIGMPIEYAYKIDFDLFRYNFDERKQQKYSGVKLCLSRNGAINICRAEYYPARTLDVLDKAEEHVLEDKFHEAVISDLGVELSWVNESNPIEPQPGDTILTGLRISNSETGGRALKGSLFTLRLACTNGARVPDEWGVARWSYDPRVTYQSNLAHFFDGLRSIEARRFGLPVIYKQLVSESLTDLEFVHIWRRLRRVIGPEQADEIFGIQPKQRRRLFNQVRSRDDPSVTEPTSWSRYEVHNSITAAARNYTFLKWRRLEQIGGSILQTAVHG